VDLEEPGVSITNALSFSKIYGFEKTSIMVKDNDGAIAGVNGMFYTMYGHHIGLMVKDKKIVSKANNYTPVVAFLESGETFIGDMNTEMKIKKKDDNNSIIVSTMNDGANEETWVLYSDIYGNSTRITRKSINYVIDNNRVIDKLVTSEPVDIPRNGYVLSRVTEDTDKYDLLEINEVVEIETTYTPYIGPVQEAFQSGGWLVKDSINVAKDYEPLMGNTRIPNPRTILGVTKDNRLILKVIDGRQPDYSYGVTGKICGDLMLKEGCINAVYLDGGASSTMVYEGKVVNSPSNKEERKVAHSILVKYETNIINRIFSKIKNFARNIMK
jgi:exopolysaccharide biosynthesis protein